MFRPAPPPGCAGAAIGRRLPDALVALGRVRRGSPGVQMGLDHGLRPGLVGGAEPESVWQYRLFHVGEVPLVELGPGPGVAERGRVGLIAVRRPSLQGDLIGGARPHRTLDVRRYTVVPVDHLVNQPGVVGMDLIRQIGAGDVLHRPVAPPHLVRKIGPAPRHQIPAREPQPTRPACAVAGVPLPPDPGQLAERRVAVHQVRAGGGDTLRQTLHELHVRGGHKLDVRHSAPLCQGPAKPPNRFPGPPIAAVNSTTREAHRGGGTDGRPGSHAPRLRRPTADIDRRTTRPTGRTLPASRYGELPISRTRALPGFRGRGRCGPGGRGRTGCRPSRRGACRLP